MASNDDKATERDGIQTISIQMSKEDIDRVLRMGSIINERNHAMCLSKAILLASILIEDMHAGHKVLVKYRNSHKMDEILMP